MITKGKRLTVAIVMLLVSALLLGTASYAWFAMNTKVKTEGLEVEAYSDSLFLQIKDANALSADYDTYLKFEKGRQSLRLSTYGFIEKAATGYKNLVKLTVNPATGNYNGSGDYYKTADSDAEGPTLAPDAAVQKHNLIHANGELKTASKTEGFYKDVGFLFVVGGTYTSGNYYEKVGNDFVKQTLSPEDSTHGMYQMLKFEEASGNAVAGTTYYKCVDATNAIYKVVSVAEGSPLTDCYTATDATAETTGATYEVGHIYYKGTDTLSKVAGLYPGTDLSKYYKVTENEITETEFATGSYYYIKNDKDYSYLGNVAGKTIVDYLYWGRAYSTAIDKSQGGNTLNIVGDTTDLSNYRYAESVYIRQAEGTNHGTNLTIKNVTVGGLQSDLSPALNILFVATSLATGETVVTKYDNGDVEAFEGKLFDRILGDCEEEIKVDIYIYYDGTDDKANNHDASVLGGQTIEFTFAIDELSYNK